MKNHARSTVAALKSLGVEIIRGVEVGVWRGDLSRDLLTQFPRLTLYMVDRWAQYGAESEFYLTSHQGRRSAKEFAAAKQAAGDSTEFAGDRAVMIQADSEAATLVVAGGLDFVFIDAGHTEKDVERDIAAWSPLVRSGGLLMGHDYNSKMEKKGVWGVKIAVDRFAERRGLEVHLGAGRVWWIEMP